MPPIPSKLIFHVADKFRVAQSCFLVSHVRLVTSRWNVYADDVHVLEQEGRGEGVGGENEETESSGASFVEQVLVVSRSVGRFDQFRKPKKQISCCCFEYSSFKAMPCYRCFILFLFKNTFVENTVHESALDFVEAVGDCVKHVNLHQVEYKWLAVPTHTYTRKKLYKTNTQYDVTPDVSPDGSEYRKADAVSLHFLRVQCVEVVCVSVAEEGGCLTTRVDNKWMSATCNMDVYACTKTNNILKSKLIEANFPESRMRLPTSFSKTSSRSRTTTFKPGSSSSPPPASATSQANTKL